MQSLKSPLAFFLCLIAFQLRAQTDNSKLSTNLIQWLHNQSTAEPNKQTVASNNKRNTATMSLFIKVNHGVDESAFSALGAEVGTKAGNIWTVRIPSKNIQEFIRLDGIEYIELAREVRMQMDSVRYLANIDSAIKGINMPMPLSGKGVVIGLIDDGFDFTHPAFYDTTYTTLRIKKAWVQEISGTPPAGYSYGAEFIDSSALLQKKFDFDNSGSHGNECASIAAGSGIGSKNAAAGRGVAYESELIFVSSPLTYLDWRAVNMTSIIDGINYIFQYATSVGKPAVVSISLGSLVGARDGGSLFAQACDNLTGNGRILVFPAMNLRLNNCHVGKSFSPTDTLLSTLVPINPIQNGEQRNYMDAWGDSLKTFCLQFGMYRNGSVINNSVVYCPDNSTKNFYMIGSDNDTCYITLTTKAQEYNKKPHATIDVFSKSKDTLCVSVIASGGAVHIWQEYFDESWATFNGDFIGNGSWAKAGDAEYTIGEMACTKSAITVGAYVSKVYWKNLQNQSYYAPINGDMRGMLANYSSKGPTLDNRMKPDISAPGGMIYGAANSYDSDNSQGGSNDAFLVSKYTSSRNNRNYYYSAGTGTSFATPVAAGVIALMLQVNPQLYPQMIKGILYKTAIKDNFTTPTPDYSLWGAGKLNGYAAIKETIRTVGTAPIPRNEASINLYPNPGHGMFTLDFESLNAGYFLVEISNATGQTIKTESWQVSQGMNSLKINLSENANGLYFISITGQGGQIVKKIMLN